MLRKKAAAALFLLLAHPALGGEAEAESQYEKLLARVKSFDRTMDFAALRLAFTETPAYDPYGGDKDAQGAMDGALDEGKHEKAVELAEAVLAKKYVDLDAQLVCCIAYKELGNEEKAAFHRFVMHGLIDSILNSGDGKDAATAYVVIEVGEEYFILNVFGCRMKQQALVGHDGHMVDRMDVVDREGRELALFFNIDLPFSWLQKKMGKATEAK